MSGPANNPSASKPRRVRFNTEGDAIAEIERLRRGPCTQVGNWTLNQICWHLNFAYRRSMSPGGPPPAPNTPEQDTARARLPDIFASGGIPPGLKAPDPAVPPAACDAKAVDELIEALRTVQLFPGPFRAHPIFGNLTVDEMRRLALIHCAHHLGHLIPVGE